MRPLATARPSAGPAPEAPVFWPSRRRGRSRRRRSSSCTIHPSRRRADRRTRHRLRSTPACVPPPVMPPSHQPVLSACASRSTWISLPPTCAVMTKSEPLLVQRPERGVRVGGDREMHGAARESPVARHACVRRLREDVGLSAAGHVDGVALLAVTARATRAGRRPGRAPSRAQACARWSSAAARGRGDAGDRREDRR